VGSKAANHDRLAHQNKTLTARVAELEKNLKEFEASGPDSVRAGKPVNGATADASWESELDAMDRKGK
jgi:outer membrane murein-binding lipoprotein Lpp